MKLLALSLWKHNGPDVAPFRLAESMKLDSFSMWTRSGVRENIVFGSRTVIQRTTLGCRQTVGLKDVPFLLHIYVRFDGLAGVCVADEEYPQRVCFGLISQTMQKFEDKVKDKWAKVSKDQEVEPPFMKEDLETFQDPKNDKICKIQRDLDDIKDIMHNNIEEILKRGETLDALMEKSDDLSMTSKQFYKKAKKANSCCKSW